MAINRQFQTIGRSALIFMIKSALKRCWMELSDSAENFVLKYCGGHKFLVNANQAYHLLGKEIITNTCDGFHYQRKILGNMKMKIVVGTPPIH